MPAPKRPQEGTTSEPTAKKPRYGFKVGPENLPDGPWKRRNERVKKDLIEAAKVKKQYSKIKARHLQSLKGAPSIPVPASLAGEEQPPVAASVVADDDDDAALHHGSASEPEWNGIADDDDTGNALEAHRAQSPSSSAAPLFMNPDRQLMMEHSQGSDRDNNNDSHQQGLPQRADSDSSPAERLRAGGGGVGGEDGTRPNEKTQGLAAKEGDKASSRQSKSESGRQRRGDQCFSKELAAASKRKAEAEARTQARQAREEERRRHMDERERNRKAMQKARAPGFRDGKRKLGREGELLLDRVKKSIR